MVYTSWHWKVVDSASGHLSEVCFHEETTLFILAVGHQEAPIASGQSEVADEVPHQ